MKSPKLQSGLKNDRSTTLLAAEAGTSLSEENDRAKRDKLNRPWNQMEETSKMTSDEARNKVALIREHLEAYKIAFEGMPFNLGGIDNLPCSMNVVPNLLEIDLVEILSPRVRNYFKMIDKFCEDHGTHRHIDFQSKLFDFKMAATQTGFEIGVLAGVIFADCSEKIVDRFERGLVINMQTCPSIVTERKERPPFSEPADNDGSDNP